MSGHCNDCGNTICVCKIEEDVQFKSIQDLTKELKEKIASQQNTIEVLKKGLEFYANRKNWLCSFIRLQDVIPFRDCDSEKNDRNPELLKIVYGGKLARETLKKLEEMEG